MGLDATSFTGGYYFGCTENIEEEEEEKPIHEIQLANYTTNQCSPWLMAYSE